MKKALVLAILTLPLLAPACSDDAPEPAPTSAEAGTDSGAFVPLPAECEATLPETVIANTELSVYVPRLRVAGDRFYFQLADGIHVTTVPGGTVQLLARGPVIPGKADAALRHATVSDFWLGDESITAVLGDAIYTVPITGGTLEWKQGTKIEDVGDVASASVFSGAYVRHGDDIYRASQDAFGWPKNSLWRVTVPGGEWREVLPENALSPAGVLLHDQGLYYFTYRAIFERGGQSLRRISLPSGDSTEILANLESPYFLGSDESIYVVSPTNLRQVLRIRPDGTSETVQMPAGVTARSPRLSHHMLETSAHYDGALYAVVPAVYQLPDDRRTTYRYVVVRFDPGASEAKFVACIPDLPFHPHTPRDTFFTEFNDIVATDAGVFVSVTHEFSHTLKASTHIFRVTP
jgi:hypothetical protein